MLVIKLTLTYFLQNVFTTEAARILAYFPCPSISHQIVFRPITFELVKRGHQVTVITPNPAFPKDSVPANLTEIDVHDVSYDIIKNYFAVTVTGKKDDVINQAKVISEISLRLIEEHFRLQEVQDLLQKQSDYYDLILLEAYFTPGLALTYKFSAPTILVSSFGSYPGNYETVGAPTHPIIYHDFFRQRLYNLTLWEKVIEMLKYLKIKKITMSAEDNAHGQIMMKKLFGPDIPPVNILKNNVDMLFLNINPIWEGNYPVPPSVIHMGGLHIKPPKELPQDLQNYLDTSKNGAIYFSFGTNVKPSLLPPSKIAIFENVLSQLPYNVIWKWDTKNFTAKSSNIKVFPWLPQSDLLRHPNVKLFITQGGLQSTDEAISAGVPLIGIPMLGDQWYNVEKYVHHKIGVRLDFEDLTEDQLRAAITEVIKEKSYRSNIIQLRTLMQDQPQTPLERTMWWIEYVLRHKGAKHLRSPAANMTWAEYLELELVSVIILATLILLGSFVTTAKVIFHILKRNRSIDKIKKS